MVMMKRGMSSICAGTISTVMHRKNRKLLPGKSSRAKTYAAIAQVRSWKDTSQTVTIAVLR